MELANLPSSPPPPEQVITTWESSRGQDLLGLRAPAERIANSLMDGVTTVSPLVRYCGFRSWIISRYVELEGPDHREVFFRFAGKCEAALVLGHLLSDNTPTGLVGTKEAKKIIESGNLRIRKLVNQPATDIYAGPSQDLAISFARKRVPGLSEERGRPLAEAMQETVGHLTALTTIDVESEEQEISASATIELANQYSMRDPSGRERELLIDAVCPPVPLPRELARLSAYSYLLQLATANKSHTLDEDTVFRAAVEGEEDAMPSQLFGTSDGWLRFLIRDMLAAVHERAVGVVIAMLQECPHETSAIEKLEKKLTELDASGLFKSLGIHGLSLGSTIGELHRKIMETVTPVTQRCGLSRWEADLDEPAVFRALVENPGPEAVALLPVAWVLACTRAGASLDDGRFSIDQLSGARVARMGLADILMPVVTGWTDSAESIAQVIARLVRRSVDQHLGIAWYHMQADPHGNVARIVSDGSTWTRVGEFEPGRATSRLYQAINWLGQLSLLDEDGITPDGTVLLQRNLTVLETALEVR